MPTWTSALGAADPAGAPPLGVDVPVVGQAEVPLQLLPVGVEVDDAELQMVVPPPADLLRDLLVGSVVRPQTLNMSKFLAVLRNLNTIYKTGAF